MRQAGRPHLARRGSVRGLTGHREWGGKEGADLGPTGPTHVTARPPVFSDKTTGDWLLPSALAYAVPRFHNLNALAEEDT